VNREIAQQLQAWIQFFREMGIEDFYARDPGSEPKRLSGIREAQPAVPSEDLDAARQPSSSVAAEPVLETQPVKTRGPISSMTPAGTLGLFDAGTPVAARKIETLEEVRQDLGDCQRCKLSRGRKHIVFGQGNPHADLVLVGEGPGADEDEQGLPFVGRAGQLLNRVLKLVGINREEIYICNVVKCRPPGNRVPEADEIAACSPFLFRQFEAIRPRFICCLGAPAAKTVLGVKEGITKIHGQLFDYAGAKAMVTVHPAYVLRNPREEKILRGDFEKIKEFLPTR
jgi:uracil-DNA glycosylase